ncbi:MAG: phosphoribosyl-AMP cyclohydrolase [Alphaproteobacteria bacterium]|nr:phosphoribosyl-AMP cyclohydrolase [Alphaproteobacteria bacterium]MBV9420793.1 phosphoribosyl-AMP cyclohydrolase [Alphaproteobacteria bacterium]MBV9542668.1 phosphoribosyl-AMP cyclohydrolase [Alphaproteobacteria bacterium]MBV9905599.1 phosphoribosyl-AMP cyclohydrolase [Alphaproteobacteria bacterium]
MTEVLSRHEFVAQVSFDKDGLVPAITQHYQSGEVLMLGYMNKHTLELSLQSGYCTYWSRSRGKVWKKGEESGHTQRIVEAHIDCDGDTLLFKVDQIGPACHTGAPTCFFREARIEPKP